MVTYMVSYVAKPLKINGYYLNMELSPVHKLHNTQTEFIASVDSGPHIGVKLL